MRRGWKGFCDAVRVGPTIHGGAARGPNLRNICVPSNLPEMSSSYLKNRNAGPGGRKQSEDDDGAQKRLAESMWYTQKPSEGRLGGQRESTVSVSYNYETRCVVCVPLMKLLDVGQATIQTDVTETAQ